MPKREDISRAIEKSKIEAQRQNKELLNRDIDNNTIDIIKTQKNEYREDTTPYLTAKQQLNDELKQFRGIVNFGTLSQLYRSPFQEEILELLKDDVNGYGFMTKLIEYYKDATTGKITPEGEYKINDAFDNFVFMLGRKGLL